MIHLYTGDRAELVQTKAGIWVLKHHQKDSCSLLRFCQSKEEADAVLAYLVANGVLPPFPEDSDDSQPHRIIRAHAAGPVSRKR